MDRMQVGDIPGVVRKLVMSAKVIRWNLFEEIKPPEVEQIYLVCDGADWWENKWVALGGDQGWGWLRNDLPEIKWWAKVPLPG